MYTKVYESIYTYLPARPSPPFTGSSPPHPHAFPPSLPPSLSQPAPFLLGPKTKL